MNEQIKVSVIMGVHNQNDKQILLQAVDSILNQSLRELEFIICNDGSNQAVSDFLREIAERDSRIILLESAENRGLAFSLNKCIEKAKGKYIARMDDDDVSKVERLKIQYDFLESHKEYAWCGTNAELLGQDGVWGSRKMPVCPSDKDFLKFSPYIHPSVMYRAEVFEKEEAYLVTDETLRCEDLEIFMRLHQKGYRGYNLQEELIQYREGAESFQKRRWIYRVNEAKIRYQNYKKMNLLFPTGWIYTLRPLVSALVPVNVIRKMKREKLEYRHGTKDSTYSILSEEVSRE